MLSQMFGYGMHAVLFVHWRLLLRKELVLPCQVMMWNGNTTETKTDISKFISFHFKFFHFRFISFFCNFFVSVSVNGIKIFPLTDISVSVNVNHTVMSVPTYQISFKSKKLSVDVLTGIETGFIIRST